MPTRGTTRKRPSTAKKTDAFALLMEDHKRVKRLFSKFEKAHESEDLDLCRQIVDATCRELEIHTTIEEEILYPAAREAVRDEDLLDEAAVEHESAKSLIEKLRELEPGDPKWAATFTVLGEYVSHHVKEEEGSMFPQAKRGKLDAQAIGERLAQRKQELESEMSDRQAMSASRSRRRALNVEVEEAGEASSTGSTLRRRDRR